MSGKMRDLDRLRDWRRSEPTPASGGPLCFGGPPLAWWVRIKCNPKKRRGPCRLAEVDPDARSSVERRGLADASEPREHHGQIRQVDGAASIDVAGGLAGIVP